ncbi:glycosyltransferase family 39 protein [Desulfoferrobacter suflitae]|uniref:glycosyltransferase family 39 protein n=1 Tax=Desulfoferrobacter suflitae TaxID=2865782 RepID=UPI002164089B|nr:glycosyltransferase family 39 protein [Desulfoferrobacter suflitae]MCK8603276.1 glycosyltransferase family 39 protein [Desulfoferrobacter suflitae]
MSPGETQSNPADGRTEWRSGSFAAMLEEHFWGLLSVTLLAALAIRLTALYQLGKTPYFDYLLWDERIYHEWAKQIASGTYQPRAAYEFSPLPAYLIAAVYWLFSPEPVYVRLMNVGLGVLTCLFIALTGRELGRGAAGLAAGAIAALYAPFILYSIVPLKTALSLLLCALVIYFLLAETIRASASKAFFLGIFLAMAFNVRGNYNVLMPLGLLLVVYSTWKFRPDARKVLFSGLVFVFGLSCGILPFLIRNYRITGDIILSTTQSGFNFYIGNNLTNKDPYYRPLPFASNSPFKQGAQFTIEASRRVGRSLTAREASSYWYKEAMKEALVNPADSSFKLIKKFIAVCNRFEAADHYDIDFLGQFVPFFKWPLPSFALLWPFGLAALLSESVHRKPVRWLLAAFVLYALTLILFFPSARYRAPLLIILIPLAPVGILQLVHSIKTKNKAKTVCYISLTTLITALEFYPLQAAGDRTAYYNTHAIVLYNAGRKEEAIDYWVRSAQMNGFFSPSANLRLAHLNFFMHNLKQAKAYLDRISDSSYQAAPKYSLLGDIHRSEGALNRAVSAYEHSLAINSGELEVRKKLVDLLNHVSPSAALAHRVKVLQLRNFYKGL